MVLLVLTEVNSLEAIKMIVRRSAYVLLPLSIVLIKYFRAIGVAYTEDGSTTMWTGVTTHKNVLGYVVMVCAVYFAENILVTRKSKDVIIDLLFLMMMVWLVFGISSSKSSGTSLSALSLGLGVLMAARWSGKDLKRFGRFLISIVLMMSLFVVVYEASVGSIFDAAMGSMGRDTTLTGRTEIWNVALNVGPGNPFFGRGYGSFWIGNTADEVWNQLTYHTHFTQSHNGYIDTYLELGALGLILLACLIWSVCRNIRQTFAGNVEYGAYRMAFLSAIVVHNLTESSYGRPTHLLWFIFLLSCVYIPVASLHRV